MRQKLLRKLPGALARISPGQGMVELAVTLPVFILALMSLISGSWLIAQQQSVTNAARSAAREAAIINPLFEDGASTGCASTYGEATAAQLAPAQTIEMAAGQGSAMVPINSSPLCATNGTAASMTSSATQSGTATVTITASPTLASPSTVTATVTYIANPLGSFWPSAAITLSASATDTVQSGP